MNYVSLGQKAKQKISTFREGGLLARLKNPDCRGFLHDIDAYPRLEELDDYVVGKLAALATTDNLKRLGYSGTRSNTGETVMTLFTAGVYRLKAIYGNSVVMSVDGAYDDHTDSGSSHWKPRLIKNEIAVREAFCRIMDELVLKLLSQE